MRRDEPQPHGKVPRAPGILFPRLWLAGVSRGRGGLSVFIRVHRGKAWKVRGRKRREVGAMEDRDGPM